MWQKLKKIISFTPEKYWVSIDEMPLYNWIKCNNGRLEYVRNGKGNRTMDIVNWMRLYNEYLATFGLDKRYKKYLEIKRKIGLLQADYVIKKDRFKLTEIEIQEAKLKDLEVHFGDGKSIETILMYLSMHLGYKLNPKETTVKEYFTILNEYGKSNKA